MTSQCRLRVIEFSPTIACKVVSWSWTRACLRGIYSWRHQLSSRRGVRHDRIFRFSDYENAPQPRSRPYARTRIWHRGHDAAATVSPTTEALEAGFRLFPKRILI